MNKINIAFLFHGNPTQGGLLMSEIKLLNQFYQYNSSDITFTIIATSEYYKKLAIKWIDSRVLTVPTRVEVITEDNIKDIERFNGIITYPTENNLFAGCIKKTAYIGYKVLSHATNKTNIPVFVRLSDNKSQILDYRSLSIHRDLKDEPSQLLNEDLKTIEKVDWSRVYWLANGYETHPWVGECLMTQKEPNRCCESVEDGESRAIYAGDDVFFQVMEYFNKYKYLESKDNYLDRLLFIGVFKSVNLKRLDVFKDIFNEDNNPKTTIFGTNTDVLEEFQSYNNIEIKEGFLKGDSPEYFEYLNNYLAYIFIGKGLEDAAYVGKTVYDCVNARIPIIVYSKCDERRMTFDNERYYFSNEFELKQIVTELQNPNTRREWLEDQQIQLLAKCQNNFKFKDYCEYGKPLKSKSSQLF